jgi:hypothetical protein
MELRLSTPSAADALLNSGSNEMHRLHFLLFNLIELAKNSSVDRIDFSHSLIVESILFFLLADTAAS